VLDKQGAQLLAVAFLVVSRTWVSDRIASLNGISSFIFWLVVIAFPECCTEMQHFLQEPL